MSHLAAGSAVAASVEERAESVALAADRLAAADRELRDAELERAEIEERLRAVRAEIGARFSELHQREQVAYFDGWAPRDLPLLPSPIHRALISPDEIAGTQKAPSPCGDDHPLTRDGARLREVPPLDALPDPAELPAWKRPFVAVFGRLFLLMGAFLRMPQRAFNEKLSERIFALEKHVVELTRDRDHLVGCLNLVCLRSIENFTFLDQCDRDRLLELHRKADQLRSEWRGDLERARESLSGELADLLEHKAPGHRLGLLELELANAELKIALARQRREIAELRQQLGRS